MVNQVVKFIILIDLHPKSACICTIQCIDRNSCVTCTFHVGCHPDCLSRQIICMKLSLMATKITIFILWPLYHQHFSFGMCAVVLFSRLRRRFGSNCKWTRTHPPKKVWVRKLAAGIALAVHWIGYDMITKLHNNTAALLLATSSSSLPYIQWNMCK